MYTILQQLKVWRVVWESHLLHLIRKSNLRLKGESTRAKELAQTGLEDRTIQHDCASITYCNCFLQAVAETAYLRVAMASDQPALADEAAWLDLLVASERVEQWLEAVRFGTPLQ